MEINLSMLNEKLTFENISSDQKKQQIIFYIKEFVDKFKKVEEMLLDYLDQNEEQELYYQLLINYLEEINMRKNKKDLKLFFHLIIQISNNHHRSPIFFSKINKFFVEYQKEMIYYFSNYEIFNLCKSNKQILLYLFQNKIIVPNQAISNVICSEKYKERKYPHYFLNEIKCFLDNEKCQEFSIENSNNFDINREIGQNNSHICEFIRKDSVEDFISFINRNNYPLTNNIELSIYETNEFLFDKTPSLIEYAAFFGSIQIFQYLLFNKVEMTPSLWLYAIHGRNPDIIHLIESESIKPVDDTFIECLIESIKCHHIEITNYILNNLLNIDVLNKNEANIFIKKLKYYNFIDLSVFNFDKYDDYFIYACKYDYISIFEFLCKTTQYDPNSKIFFESKFKKIEDSLLNIIIRKGNIEILQILLSRYKVDSNIKYIKTKKKCIEEKIYTIFQQGKKEQIMIERTEEKAPIIIAVENGNFEIIKLLTLQSEIDINIVSIFQRLKYNCVDNQILERTMQKQKEYKTALIIAIEKKLYDIVQFLLTLKINTNAKYIQFHSLYKKYSNLSRRPDLYEENKEKDLLIVAIESGNINVVQQLIALKSTNLNSKYIKLVNYSHKEINYVEKAALIVAIENENVEIIRLLLSNKDINVNEIQIDRRDCGNLLIENNALFIATMKNNSEIVEILLSKDDINVNIKYRVKYTMVEYLADRSIYDFNEPCLNKEKTALFEAIEKENEKIVQLLLSRQDTNVNSKLINRESLKIKTEKNKYYSRQTKCMSEFIKAVEKGNLYIVRLFLQRNDVDVNFLSSIITDSNIYEYYESEYSKSEVYKKFEKKKEKEAALHIATRNCNKELIKMILKNPKVDVNIKYTCKKDQTYIINKKEKTKSYQKAALNIAVENQNLEIVRLFLEMDQIDLNAKYIKNSSLYKEPIIKTPLMITVDKENINIIKLLMTNKNIEITDELKNNKIIKNILDESIFI